MKHVNEEELFRRGVWEVLKTIKLELENTENGIIKYKIRYTKRNTINKPFFTPELEENIIKMLYKEQIISKKPDDAYIEGINYGGIDENIDYINKLEMFVVNKDKFNNIYKDYASLKLDDFETGEYVIEISKKGDIKVYDPRGKVYEFTLRTTDYNFKFLWTLATSRKDLLSNEDFKGVFENKSQTSNYVSPNDTVYNALTSLRNASGLPDELRKYIFQQKDKRYCLNAVVKLI